MDNLDDLREDLHAKPYISQLGACPQNTDAREPDKTESQFSFVLHYPEAFDRDSRMVHVLMLEVFPNAPISEALIDIRVKLSSSVSLSDLERLHSHIAREYPDKKTRRMWEGTFEMGNEKDPLQKVQFQADGYAFTSPDGKQVVQYRLEGFTFSRLRPYTRWEELFAEARRLWGVYADHIKPVNVTGLAVRYINSIEIPFKTFDYDDYFTAAPRIPPLLPQNLAHFFTRLVIPFADRDAIATITTTPSNKPDPINTDIILDIAVSKDAMLEPNDGRVWDIISILREIKNEIFFGSITERTKEFFR